MSWRVVCDDDFTHADTSVGGAGTTTGVPTTGGASGPWKDVAGSLFNIVSNKLQAAEGVTNGFLTQFLTRPSGEDSVGQQISMTGNVPESGSGIVIGVGLRYQSGSGNYYLAHLLDGGGGSPPGQINVYKIVSGSPSSIIGGAQNWTTPMVSGHNYTIILAANDPISGTTTLDYTVHDETANADVMSGSVDDSESSLQSSGGYAVVPWAAFSGFPATSQITRVTTYIPDVTTDFDVSATTSIVLSDFATENGGWRLITDDDFTHADTVPGITPSNSISVPTLGGNGTSQPWIDLYGGDFGGPGGSLIGWHISGDKLASDPIFGSIASGGYLIREPVENSTSERFIVTLLGSDITSGSIGYMAYCFRYQASTGGSYFCYLLSNGSSHGVFNFLKMTNATPVSNGSPDFIITGDSISEMINTSDTYEIDANCSIPVGGVTTFNFTITNTTTSTVVYTNSVTDSEVSLQGTGGFAVLSTTAGSMSGTLYCSRIRTYIPAGPIDWIGQSHTNCLVTMAASETMQFSFGVVAISRIVVHGTNGDAMRVGTHFISAASSFVTADLGVGHSIGDKPKSASSSMILLDTNMMLSIGSKFADAMTSFIVTQSNGVIAIGQKFLSAITTFGVAESDSKSRDAVSIGIPDGVILWDSAQGYTSPILLSMSGLVVFFDSASLLHIGPRSLSAHTNIVLSDSGSAPTNWTVLAATSIGVADRGSIARTWTLSAATSFRSFDSGLLVDNRSLDVSAETIINALDLASFHLTGPVSAFTAISLSDKAGFPVFDRSMSARTGVVVIGSGFTRIDKLMAATTSIGVVTLAAERADWTVSAESSLMASGPGGKNMDWMVSATTSIGTSDLDKQSPLYTPAGTGHVALSDSAVRVLTGTLASNNIIIVDIARATRVLSWRPNALTLPAGGYSPHA